MRFGAIAVLGWMVAAGVAQSQQVKATEPQVPTQQQKKAVVILQGVETTLYGSACPGALRASQQATGGATVWTTALEDQKDGIVTARPQGLGVHIEYADKSTAVRTLELRVSYEPIGLKRMQIGLGTNGFASAATERAKNFNIDREAATLVNADLFVGAAATITRVNLISATFADGSVWRAPTQDACSVVPSRFVRVAKK